MDLTRLILEQALCTDQIQFLRGKFTACGEHIAEKKQQTAAFLAHKYSSGKLSDFPKGPGKSVAELGNELRSSDSLSSPLTTSASFLFINIFGTT